MSETTPKVDWYFEKPGQWKDENAKLREIVLDCDVAETLKWGQPCYTSGKKNIVIIQGFKEYCALMFFKGAIMKDPENILIQLTENVQSARQIRFTSVDQIRNLASTIKAYIREAIAIEEIGLKVELKQTSDFPVVDELRQRLDADADFKTAFEALTPGRQRGYLLYFASAKQPKTRIARIDKYAPHIMAGKGLMDEEKK